MPPAAASSPDRLLVACLCAQLCGTCRDHEAVFLKVQAQFDPAEARFVRIDIEDEADLLDGVEVENFPTLLVARGDAVLFFGTITPHEQTLLRLVQSALAGELPPPGAAPELAALARRIATS